MTRDEPLLQDFPRPDRSAWEAAAAKALRGKPLEDLRWHTDDGIACDALFDGGEEHGAALPHQKLSGLLQAVPAWAVRQRVDAADPERAGRIAGAAVTGGADEITLVFDRRGRLGLDPEEEVLLDTEDDVDPGVDGCAIYDADALATALADVDLATTRIALDAGAASAAALGMLLDLAAARGVDAADLAVELGSDPLREAVLGTRAADLEALLAEVPATFAATRGHRGVQPFAAHSAPYHDAGAGAATELACTLATAITYIGNLTAAGVPADDAVQAVSLRFAVDTDLYVEVAKLRAARLLWAKIAQAFGADDRTVRIHAESSRRSWSSDDVHTNLLRTSVQGFVAGLGCCDSISLAPYDHTHDEDEEQAQILARNQLILLREESMLSRVADPCGGAYAFEAITDAISRAAWKRIQDLARDGGITAALTSGRVQDEIHLTAAARRTALHTGDRCLVGTTRFVDPRFRKDSPSAPDSAAIAARGRSRNPAPPADVPVAADDAASLQAAAHGGCTLGAITAAVRGDRGFRLTPELRILGPEGEAFETLRAEVLATGLSVRPRLVETGRLAQARLEFARDQLTAGGFKTLPPCAADAPVDEAAALEVLCGSDDAVDAWLAERQPQPRTGPPLLIAGPPRPATALPAVIAHLHRGADALHTLRSVFLGTAPELPETDA